MRVGRGPRYVVVTEPEVPPDVVEMAERAVRRGAAELDLGTVPQIRWFADTRELQPANVAAATEIYEPGDGEAKAGSVPPYVRYSPQGGWSPSPPIIMLSRTQCLPDTPLHELRHLWQIKAGLYRADETSTTELEDDADAWAAAKLQSR